MGSCVSVTVEVEGGPCGCGGRRRRRKQRTTTHAHNSIGPSTSPPTTCSFEEDLRLHRVPGRIFLNGSTRFASLFSKQGRKGLNQDSMLLWENFHSKEDTVFCGVFDGHGPHGHRVAKKVRDSFPLNLMAQWDLLLSPAAAAADLDVGALTQSFLNACKVMDKELKLQHHIDCYCSGTTAVTLVKQGRHLVIANVGDSRAVLCTRDHRDSLVALQLTTDLKPNLPREAERIRLCKGRVFAVENGLEVARVWLPNVDSPGLAMARAFGDFCLKDFGVISVPEVSYHRLTEMDEFVVLATDGVWDVLSNKEVVGIVASVPRSCAARTVVEAAVHAWRTKFPASKIDDCSVVCLFFDSGSDSELLKSAGYTAADNMTTPEEEEEESVDQSDIGSCVSATNTLVDQCPPPILKSSHQYCQGRREIERNLNPQVEKKRHIRLFMP